MLRGYRSCRKIIFAVFILFASCSHEKLIVNYSGPETIEITAGVIVGGELAGFVSGAERTSGGQVLDLRLKKGVRPVRFSARPFLDQAGKTGVELISLPPPGTPVTEKDFPEEKPSLPVQASYPDEIFEELELFDIDDLPDIDPIAVAHEMRAAKPAEFKEFLTRRQLVSATKRLDQARLATQADTTAVRRFDSLLAQIKRARPQEANQILVTLGAEVLEDFDDEIGTANQTKQYATASQLKRLALPLKRTIKTAEAHLRAEPEARDLRKQD